MSVQDRLALLRNQLERVRETHVSQLLAVSQAALDEFDPSRRATFGTALKRSTQSTLDELRAHGQRVTGHVVTTAKQLFLPLDDTTKAAILEIAKRLFDEELYTRRFDVQCQSLFRKAAGRGLNAEGWTRVDIERAGHHAATANTIRRELAMLSDELEFMRLQSEQTAQVSLSRLGDFSMLSLMHDTVDILKSNGTKIVGRKASVQQNKIFMDAKDLLIEPEDLIIRRMSNGAEETYKVIDPRFYERHGGIQAHYQMDVRKLGLPEASSAVQSITYNITGNNARINQNSTDNSTNVVQIDNRALELVESLRTELKSALLETAARNEALEVVEEIDAAFKTGTPKKSVVSALLRALPDVANVATIASAIASLF